MQVAPSRAPMALGEFLEARRKQHEALKEWACGRPYGEGVAHMVLPLPSEEAVLCDSCSAHVAGPQVYLVKWGREAVCQQCYARHEHEPVEWREILPDGSLGLLVELD